jgi:hypothetical protein
VIVTVLSGHCIIGSGIAIVGPVHREIERGVAKTTESRRRWVSLVVSLTVMPFAMTNDHKPIRVFTVGYIDLKSQ